MHCGEHDDIFVSVALIACQHGVIAEGKGRAIQGQVLLRLERWGQELFVPPHCSHESGISGFQLLHQIHVSEKIIHCDVSALASEWLNEANSN